MRRALEERTAADRAPAILFDLREVVDSSALTAEFLRSLPTADEWQDCHREVDGKRAVLTNSASLYGFVRLYQLSAGSDEDATLKLFQEPRLALEYIGFLEPS